MATWTYDDALRRLLIHEGGYSNHPSDPGGPTNFGITIYDFRKYINPDGTADDVRRMSVDQAKAIYKSKYWNAMRCDELPPGVDYAIFDYGVNSGIGRAPKVLKRICGLDAGDAKVTDALIAEAKKRDPKALVDAICEERLRFLKSLRTWPTFGNGWGRRVKEVHEAASMMAKSNKPRPLPAPFGEAQGKGSVPRPIDAQGSVVSGGFLGSVVTWASSNPVSAGLLTVAIISAMVGALYLINRWHKDKQETPMPVSVVPVQGK